MPAADGPLQDVQQDDIPAQKATHATHAKEPRTGDNQHAQKQPQHLANKRVILTLSNRTGSSASEETAEPIKLAGSFGGSVDGDNDRALILGISRVSTSDRGRIMVADSHIPKGTLLFAVTAQATVCDSDNRKRRCGSCFRPLQAPEGSSNSKTDSIKKEPGIACEDCHEIWYCHHRPHDRDCSQWDYQDIHQFECQFLRQLYNGSDDVYTSLGAVIRLQDSHRKALDRFRSLDGYDQDYCRVLIRTLIHRFKEYTGLGLGSQSNEDLQRARVSKHKMSMDEDPQPLPYSAVLELVENKECVPISKLEGDMMDVARVLDAFQEHLYQQYPHKTEVMNLPRLTLEELLSLVLKEESNSFGLYEYPTGNVASETPIGPDSPLPPVALPVNNAKQGYGLGLFVDWYLYSFNHSCSPNLYHVAHNSQLLVYTARDIERGEELNISYLEFGPHYRILSERDGAAEQEARKEALTKRRAILKHHFYFDCGCKRCAWEATLSYKAAEEELTRERMSQSEETFLREGILCSRKGCFGFYAPPEVLNVMGRFKDDSEHWHCIACGCKQL
ncbi:hypothetical protein BGZ72_004780 [Mortierella alpina]|nr:hypothetical protein BGZ72_004780 [Mortierella alpina]